MTLCAAGINRDQNRIVAICDRKVSFWGGSFAGDGMAFKLRTLSQQWYVMFAGPNSPLVPLLDAVTEAVAKIKQNTLRNIAHVASRVTCPPETSPLEM